MNAPYRLSRIDRLLAQAKAGTAAVMAEVEAMKPELRRRREEDMRRKISDLQFDAEQEAAHQGISTSQYIRRGY